MDLWDNVEKLPDQQHIDRTEHGRGRNARRLSEQGLLSLLRTWLLQDYTAAYCRSLGATRIFRRCYWIDALGIDAKARILPDVPDESSNGGRGRARKKNGALPPALQSIAALALELAQASKPITLNGLVFASGSSKRKEARSVTTTGEVVPVVGKESSIVYASWLEVGARVLKEIEQSPAIFVLNPLGATLFSYEDLAPLYQRAVPTEVCLLIPHKQIELRLATALGASVQSSEQASALTNLLRTDRWKALSLEEGQRQHTIASFLDLLVATLQRHFVFPVQRLHFPVQVGPATIESIPYTLLFATRRQDSLYAMNDAFCCLQRRVEEQSYNGVLSEEWFQAQQQQQLVARTQYLTQRIQQVGMTQRMRRWPDLRQHMLLEQFGQFTVREYDAMMQRLLAEGRVRCSWRRQPVADEGEGIPGNDDTLIWS